MGEAVSLGRVLLQVMADIARRMQQYRQAREVHGLQAAPVTSVSPGSGAGSLRTAVLTVRMPKKPEGANRLSVFLVRPTRGRQE
jgi:hypothetical protein